MPVFPSRKKEESREGTVSQRQVLAALVCVCFWSSNPKTVFPLFLVQLIYSRFFPRVISGMGFGFRVFPFQVPTCNAWDQSRQVYSHSKYQYDEEVTQRREELKGATEKDFEVLDTLGKLSPARFVCQK